MVAIGSSHLAIGAARRRAAWLALVGIVLLGTSARAFEVPPTGSLVFLQTNSSEAAALTRGDWYTNDANGIGAGYHYVTIHVPCSWPTSRTVSIDLFSPEMSANNPGLDEEFTGGPGNTQFEVYDAGTAIVSPNQPGPGAAGSLHQQTYAPSSAAEQWVRFYTLPAPVACGAYVLRAATLGPDDDNSWRLRVGWDDDADPNDTPPATTDDADGIPGTDDEIIIGLVQVTFQHNEATDQCLNLWEFTNPGQPSMTFHNFDMDGNTSVAYTAPGGGGVTAGTVSGGTVWNNGGISTTRGGDTIANPTDRLVADPELFCRQQPDHPGGADGPAGVLRAAADTGDGRSTRTTRKSTPSRGRSSTTRSPSPTPRTPTRIPVPPPIWCSRTRCRRTRSTSAAASCAVDRKLQRKRRGGDLDDRPAAARGGVRRGDDDQLQVAPDATGVVANSVTLDFQDSFDIGAFSVVTDADTDLLEGACFATADTEDELLGFNVLPTTFTAVGPLGVSNVEAIAYDTANIGSTAPTAMRSASSTTTWERSPPWAALSAASTGAPDPRRSTTSTASRSTPYRAFSTACSTARRAVRRTCW